MCLTLSLIITCCLLTFTNKSQNTQKNVSILRLLIVVYGQFPLYNHGQQLKIKKQTKYLTLNNESGSTH